MSLQDTAARKHTHSVHPSVRVDILQKSSKKKTESGKERESEG